MSFFHRLAHYMELLRAILPWWEDHSSHQPSSVPLQHSPYTVQFSVQSQKRLCFESNLTIPTNKTLQLHSWTLTFLQAAWSPLGEMLHMYSKRSLSDMVNGSTLQTVTNHRIFHLLSGIQFWTEWLMSHLSCCQFLVHYQATFVLKDLCLRIFSIFYPSLAFSLSLEMLFSAIALSPDGQLLCSKTQTASNPATIPSRAHKSTPVAPLLCRTRTVGPETSIVGAEC